jgi:hypothetical protein
MDDRTEHTGDCYGVCLAGHTAEEPLDGLDIHRGNASTVDQVTPAGEQFAGRYGLTKICWPGGQRRDGRGRRGTKPDHCNPTQPSPFDDRVGCSRRSQHHPADPRRIVDSFKDRGQCRTHAPGDVISGWPLRPRKNLVLTVQNDGIGVCATNIDPDAQVSPTLR